MKRYIYPLYSNDIKAKENYYDEVEKIKSTYNYVKNSFKWSGDCTVVTYEKDGKKVEIWDDQEYGVPDEIRYLDEESD